MTKEKRLNIVGAVLLLLAAFVWGTSFLILKNTIAELPPLYVLGIRFFVSAILIGLIFLKKTVKITKEIFCRGALIGVAVFFAYLSQTYGLKMTTPGQNAFITSLYCVMTPFFMWAMYKSKPKSYNIIAAVICVIGVGLVAISNGEGNATNVTLGNLLTFIGAIGYVFQVILTDKFSKKTPDTLQLLIVQLFTIGVLFIVCSLAIEIPIYGIKSFALNGKQILNILYLTLACTLFAQFAQMIGQKLTTANQSAVLLSLEGVFGTLFSVIMGEEKLTALMVCGFVAIFVATLISELKVDFKKMFTAKDKNKNKVYEIANGDLKIKISTFGAEMISVVKNNKERLWQNDNDSWEGHAPVLFPWCGQCAIIVDGKKYKKQMHGFANVSDFTVIKQEKDYIKLCLVATEKTKKLYPYDFAFYVSYRTSGDSVAIEYEIENKTDGDMFFFCGGHESFALNSELEDYEIVFEKEEVLDSLITDDTGRLSGQSKNMGTGRVLSFRKYPLINSNTFIFKEVKSRKVWLKNVNGDTVAEASFEGFPNLLFWRPNNAKTVCIEPWLNLPDIASETETELKDKNGVVHLRKDEKISYLRKIKYYD